jgi:DNA-binding transcriptional MerR regulator
MGTDEHSGGEVVELPRGTRGGTKLIQQVEQRHFIVTLRRRGMSFAQIAEALEAQKGITMEPASVAQYVRRYLDALTKEDLESAEELRALENERLDELLAVWGPKARGGDVKAAQVVLKISDQRAKLNGLNSAKRVEHHHTGSLVHELGTDPHEIAREREAWLTAGGDASDSDIVDIDAIPVPDA